MTEKNNDPIKIGVFGYLDSNKRNFILEWAQKQNWQIDDQAATWNDEFVTTYPGDKPIIVVSNSEVEIVEYPHSFYPHIHLDFDLAIVVLNWNQVYAEANYNLYHICRQLEEIEESSFILIYTEQSSLANLNLEIELIAQSDIVQKWNYEYMRNQIRIKDFYV